LIIGKIDGFYIGLTLFINTNVQCQDQIATGDFHLDLDNDLIDNTGFNGGVGINETGCIVKGLWG
jgi:hypothetical protein